MAQRGYNFHKCIIRYLCGWVQISDDVRDAGLVELTWQRYDVNKLVQGCLREPILKGLACHSFNSPIDFHSPLFRRYLSSYNSQLVHVTRRGFLTRLAMFEVCQQKFNCLPVIFGWRRRLHHDILGIIHRDFSCMNVTLYSMIHMLGVLVMRGVLVHSAVVALHLMLHKHNHNKLTLRLIPSESNGYNQPTSTTQFPRLFGRLYPLFTDPSLLISGIVSLCRDLHFLYT